MVGEWRDTSDPCKRLPPTEGSRGQQCGHTATECCTQGSKTDASTVLGVSSTSF